MPPPQPNRSKGVVVLLLIHYSCVHCVWQSCVWSLFCYVCSILSAISRFAINALGGGGGELVALLVLSSCWTRTIQHRVAVSDLYVSFPRGAESLSVVCDCGIFRFLLTHLIIYVYALITKSSADWESRPPFPGKSRHHRPNSETPLKWLSAGGPMVARLEYWYGPPLPSVKYDA